MTNTITVRDTRNYENVVEGGSTSTYTVISCDVDEEKGTLEYERRNFPAVPCFTGQPAAEQPEMPRFSKSHVSNLTTINDEELALLRERGVRIILLRDERFLNIPNGTRFATRHAKRLMTCVKVELTEVIAGHSGNAVILLDHTGMPAEDLGKLVYIREDEMVEISCR